MKRVQSAAILGTLFVSVQCTDAAAPLADPPIVERPAPRIAFVTQEPGGQGGFVFIANADGSGLR